VAKSTSPGVTESGFDDTEGGCSESEGKGDSRATPGCDGRRPDIACVAGGGEENEGEGGRMADEECPVCAVVLRVLPTEDVVLYDSCQASAVVSSCGRPWVDVEDKDAEEGGSGGEGGFKCRGCWVDSTNQERRVSMDHISMRRDRRTEVCSDRLREVRLRRGGTGNV
jgi:hypothetical protein